MSSRESFSRESTRGGWPLRNCFTRFEMTLIRILASVMTLWAWRR